MKEVLRTNDMVTLSWASAVLKDADVPHHVFDQHTSSLQGSILAIEKRLLVGDDDEGFALGLLRDAGIDVRGTEPAETLLGGRVRMAGQEHGLKTTTDTVMLAAAVVVQEGARVLDAGCGAAGAMLCLAWRLPSTHITGLERDPVLAGLARRNIALNDAAARVTVHEGDIADARHPGERFDVVMTNPPHLDARRSRAPRDPRRADAMVETMPLEDWIGHCLKRLAHRGSIVLVHRAERLGDILGILAPRTGAIDIMPLLPRDDGSPARRVLVKATKGSSRPLRLLPGLVLHGGDGRYSPQAQRVLTQGAALEWC